MQPDSAINTTGPSQTQQSLSLPVTVATKRDVVRLQLILEQYIDELIRSTATSPEKAVSIPPEIVQFCAINNIHKLDTHQSEQLKKMLMQLMETSPVIHIALSVEPDEKALNKFTDWFRREVHPACLLQVSVQPSIAGGCIVRTGSRIYDFSFRHMLLVSQKKLVEALYR